MRLPERIEFKYYYSITLYRLLTIRIIIIARIGTHREEDKKTIVPRLKKEKRTIGHSVGLTLLPSYISLYAPDSIA